MADKKNVDVSGETPAEDPDLRTNEDGYKTPEGGDPASSPTQKSFPVTTRQASKTTK